MLVGTISTGAASDDVKLSVKVAAPPLVIVTDTFETPLFSKLPSGVWITAVYGTA